MNVATVKLNRPRGSRQRGAALIVGLLLLLVVTLLAIAGMNTASVEFIMAGNEQYRSRAFQAAEAGIEQSLASGTFNPGTATTQTVSGTVTIDTKNHDNYTALIARALDGAAQPAIWGNSWNSFATYHFQIDSTGTSVRNSQSVNTQGVAVISPWDPTIMADKSLATDQLTAPAAPAPPESPDGP
jgi:type IV pilus assembly protein PilX